MVKTHSKYTMFDQIFINLENYLQFGCFSDYETLKDSLYELSDDNIELVHGLCKMFIENNIINNDDVKLRIRHFQLLLNSCQLYQH